MITWQQTIMPSLTFYALATVVGFGVAALIAGLANILGRLEASGKDASK